MVSVYGFITNCTGPQHTQRFTVEELMTFRVRQCSVMLVGTSIWFIQTVR